MDEEEWEHQSSAAAAATITTTAVVAVEATAAACIAHIQGMFQYVADTLLTRSTTVSSSATWVQALWECMLLSNDDINNNSHHHHHPRTWHTVLTLLQVAQHVPHDENNNKYNNNNITRHSCLEYALRALPILHNTFYEQQQQFDNHMDSSMDTIGTQ